MATTSDYNIEMFKDISIFPLYETVSPGSKGKEIVIEAPHKTVKIPTERKRKTGSFGFIFKMGETWEYIPKNEQSLAYAIKEANYELAREYILNK